MGRGRKAEVGRLHQPGGWGGRGVGEGKSVGEGSARRSSWKSPVTVEGHAGTGWGTRCRALTGHACCHVLSGTASMPGTLDKPRGSLSLSVCTQPSNLTDIALHMLLLLLLAGGAGGTPGVSRSPRQHPWGHHSTVGPHPQHRRQAGALQPHGQQQARLCGGRHHVQACLPAFC
jgi:hypothetical protein